MEKLNIPFGQPNAMQCGKCPHKEQGPWKPIEGAQSQSEVGHPGRLLISGVEAEI